MLSDRNGNPPILVHTSSLINPQLHGIAASTPNLGALGADFSRNNSPTGVGDGGLLLLGGDAFGAAHKSSESNESLPTNNTTTTTSAAFDSSDILDLPLPAIPVKRERRAGHPAKSSQFAAKGSNSTADNSNTSRHNSGKSAPRIVAVTPKQFSSLPTSHRAAAQHRRHSSIITTGGKHATAAAVSASALDQYGSGGGSMHYHSTHEKPRYLFGERSHQGTGGGAGGQHAPHLGATGHSASVQLAGDEERVYWNHSGWMQVQHQHQRSFDKSPHRSGGSVLVSTAPSVASLNDRRRHLGHIGGGRSPASSFDGHHAHHMQHGYQQAAEHYQPKPQLQSQQQLQQHHQQQQLDGRARSNALRAELNQHAAFMRNSKIEELISRSEARRSASGSAAVPLKKLHELPQQPKPQQQQPQQRYHRHHPASVYSIDPQISAILNERPGFLPVKRLTDNESPPPVTPIISPPPAFQDTNQKANLRGGNSNSNSTTSSPSKFHLTVSSAADVRRPIPATAPVAAKATVAGLATTPPTQQPQQHAKGMVFSRSFEYDNRKSRDYKETFSKSFDYDLGATSGVSPVLTPEKLRTKMTFNNLTGVSPNYLTKKESNSGANRSRTSSRDASPVYQSPQPHNELQSTVEPTSFKPKTRIRNTLSVKPEHFMSLDDAHQSQKSPSQQQQGRSRRAQFSRLHHESSSSSAGSQGFRSIDQGVSGTTNLRLNSCDSGARSGE